MGSKTFKNLYTELTGLVPYLPIPLAKTLLQRAWEDVCNARQWSFQVGEGIYISPAAISSGSFSITQYSNTITADATALAALTGLTNPFITQRQIKFGTSVYTVSDASTFSIDGVLTLDRIVLESTNTTASYSCYRSIYGYPLDNTGAEVIDFLRFNSIYYPSVNLYFTELNGSRQALDRIDPQRTVSGNPYGLFVFAASNNAPKWEMYPNPTSSAYYIVSYQKRFTEQSDSSIFPNSIPDILPMERAQYYACLWAESNKGKYPQLQGTNWRLLATEHNIAYSNPRQTLTHPLGRLEEAMRNDEEMYPQNIILPPNQGLYSNPDYLNTTSVGSSGDGIDIDGRFININTRLG